MEFYLSQITYWATNFAPRSWAFCAGQILAISQFTALFSLMGTSYGGDGRTSFGLPDLRGRVPVGSSDMGHGPGLGTYIRGVKGGQETVTLVVNEMPSHNHTIDTSQAQILVRFGANSGQADHSAPTNGSSLAAPFNASNSTAVNGYNSVTPNVALEGPSAQLAGTISAGLTGGGQAHENRQPFQAMNACICTVGLFPSRN